MLTQWPNGSNWWLIMHALIQPEEPRRNPLPRREDYSDFFWRECTCNQLCGNVDGVDGCLAHVNVLVILNFSCGEILLVPLYISKLRGGPPCESSIRC